VRYAVACGVWLRRTGARLRIHFVTSTVRNLYEFHIEKDGGARTRRLSVPVLTAVRRGEDRAVSPDGEARILIDKVHCKELRRAATGGLDNPVRTSVRGLQDGARGADREPDIRIDEHDAEQVVQGWVPVHLVSKRGTVCRRKNRPGSANDPSAVGVDEGDPEERNECHGDGGLPPDHALR
jgi:hypothetical protein